MNSRSVHHERPALADSLSVSISDAWSDDMSVIICDQCVSESITVRNGVRSYDMAKNVTVKRNQIQRNRIVSHLAKSE